MQTDPNHSTKAQPFGSSHDELQGTPSGAPVVKTFTMALDGVDVPLILTRKALLDFELQGLEVMDECLFKITERLTPANAPHLCPTPLDLMGEMMLDGANTGNIRKVMLCALWLGHHYPSISGLVGTGPSHKFVYHTTSHDTVSNKA